MSFIVKNNERFREGDSFTLTKEGTIDFKDRIVVDIPGSNMAMFLRGFVNNSTGNGTYHILQEATGYFVYEYEQDNSWRRVTILTKA
jgi:hypothetical protein